MASLAYTSMDVLTDADGRRLILQRTAEKQLVPGLRERRDDNFNTNIPLQRKALGMLRRRLRMSRAVAHKLKVVDTTHRYWLYYNGKEWCVEHVVTMLVDVGHSDGQRTCEHDMVFGGSYRQGVWSFEHCSMSDRA